MLINPWKRNKCDNGLHTLRVIRRTQQDQEKCHHLAILLRSDPAPGGFWNGFEDVDGFVGREMTELPKRNYLELSLLLKKKDRGYYCPQCGERFDQAGYRFYQQLFERAKACGFSVWKLKALYVRSRGREEGAVLRMIRKGRQIYRCPVSRMQAGFIKVRRDTDRLYEELIQRFR